MKTKRPIKFRAKSWYGNPSVWGVGHVYESLGDWWMKFKHGNLCRIEPETIGQFTGLTDINGKEIYEGDIVDLVEDKNYRGVVVWNSANSGFTLQLYSRFSPSPIALGEWLPLKVVGNIYDTTEETQ